MLVSSWLGILSGRDPAAVTLTRSHPGGFELKWGEQSTISIQSMYSWTVFDPFRLKRLPQILCLQLLEAGIPI
jgi:hypothetical protein